MDEDYEKQMQDRKVLATFLVIVFIVLVVFLSIFFVAALYLGIWFKNTMGL